MSQDPRQAFFVQSLKAETAYKIKCIREDGPCEPECLFTAMSKASQNLIDQIKSHSEGHVGHPYDLRDLVRAYFSVIGACREILPEEIARKIRDPIKLFFRGPFKNGILTFASEDQKFSHMVIFILKDSQAKAIVESLIPPQPLRLVAAASM